MLNKPRRTVGRANTHLETSLLKTFRVVEVEEGAEGPIEEPTNPRTEVGVDLHTGKGKDPIQDMKIEIETENTGNGMRVSQQVPAPEEAMKRSLGRDTRNRWRWRQKSSIGPTLDIIQRNTRRRRELEAPVQGGEKGRVGETTAMTDRTIGETMTMKEGVGETTAQKGKVGETTAQDMNMKEEEEGVGDTTALMKGTARGGGTLVRTDEGYAQGPVVMEGPL